MLKTKQAKFKIVFLLVFICVIAFSKITFGQGVKRIVIIKGDGLPAYFVDQFVKLRDPLTGRSKLPWIEEVFYKNGTRLENFYVRGISLSAPSWSLLDTGQHLQIKGNIEFDRYTLSNRSYLNFIPFQIEYGLKIRVDMLGAEVLDRLKTPLLIDAFQPSRRVAGFQIFQRDNNWGTFAKGFTNVFPTKLADLADEFTIGFGFRQAPEDQVERDIIKYLQSKPEIDYLDTFTAEFDHTAHYLNDDYSKYKALQDLDSTIGRIWMAIQNSPRANETALFLVSDHGINSKEGVYSQGFSLLKLLGSADGGGHHIVTKRRPLTDYEVIPEIPLFPISATASKDSLYLKGESEKYPTVLADFDGNERASIYFRDSDLNILHLLLKQLQNNRLAAKLRPATTDAFFEILNRRRADWEVEISQFQEELSAARRSVESQQKIIAAFPKKYTAEELYNGTDKENIRLMRLNSIVVKDEVKYQEFLRVLSNLVSLRKENFNPSKLKIEDYIAANSIGERNSVYKLQNYVVGLSPNGIVLDEKGVLDFERSFRRINYFEYLISQKVLNNVQKALSNRPIDFVSSSIPLKSIAPFLKADLMSNCDAVWLYGGAEKQALILTRRDVNGKISLRYLPVANLKQLENGVIQFQVRQWGEGFPLKIFEDPELDAGSDKITWLNEWHTDIEWLNAVHKTTYSNGIIGLAEQLNEQSIAYFEDRKDATPDEQLLQRMVIRQRSLVRADLLVLANDHWNFDVVGFNPGGNHAGFLRVATNSTFMMAGGNDTNIPRGLNVTTPYDSLSFVPTVFALMGKVDEDGNPNDELYKKGFRKFPGPTVSEIFEKK